jgi:FKBP-type peptidyl-prolyl cis-trans isomerase (trigger factor)
MKSKATHIIDFESVPLSAEECTVVFPPRDKYITTQLHNIAQKYAVSREACSLDEAAPGDIATLALTSSLPKFNRALVQVNVGKNYFNHVVEQAVIGMKKGDTRQVQVEEVKVGITLVKFTRRDIPSITDKMVADEQIPGLDTVEKYRSQIYERGLYEASMKALYLGAYNKIVNQMMAGAEFTIDTEDLEAFAAEEMAKIKRSTEKEPEKYVKALQAYVGRNTIANFDELIAYIDKDFPLEEMEAAFHKAASIEFHQKLLAAAYYEKEKISFTPEYYRKAMAEFAEMSGTSPEEMEKQIPYEHFIQFRDSEFSRKILYYLLTCKRIVKETD